MKTISNFLAYIFSKDLFLQITLSSIISIISIWYFYSQKVILAYGDAESHLNISKRVIDSLTPGLAQLGGIWLPLPHLLMIPLVYFTFLWQTGLAGSIISSIAFVISSVFIYKLSLILLKNKTASYVAFFTFILNPNILYMQSTPLTEMPLIVFFILSTYYFVKFLYEESNIFYIILSAFFGFCATLSRYDGWFLVLFEGIIFFVLFVMRRKNYFVYEGKFILFGTLAYFGIFLWFLWDFLILGDPLYFTNSPFSAKSQQQGWLFRGELPAYKNLIMSISYYGDTAMRNVGILLAGVVLIGFIVFLFDKKISQRFFILLILTVPFVFYVATLYLGQSVIFIPDLTPVSYPWRLFNVRYGIMMVPFAALMVGYLFSKLKLGARWLLIPLLLLQTFLFGSGVEPTITLQDGVSGLSASKSPDAQHWISVHYDKGFILLDDYSRTISIIKSGLPIQDVIYVGNKPYWQQSLKQPEKYATWIVMQKNDSIWNDIYENPQRRGELFKYFNKVYTSPNILIFKRIS